MTHDGILLINTGSPDSTSVPDVRRYLREFLMDERVLDVPLVARAAIVYGCILPFRPKRSAELYRRIWTTEGSPLTVTSIEVARKLEEACGLPVELAMRYGNPSVEHALRSLEQRGVQNLLVFPMFPHYAMSSYESAVVKIQETVHRSFAALRLSVVSPYYNDPRYIQALARSAIPHLGDCDHLLFSFHGMPVRHLAKADRNFNYGDGPDRVARTCYRHQSEATVSEMLDRLRWPQERASIAYQSRLGRDKWLEPHTDREFHRLARNGVRRLAVMCPSFTVDCLETLEEIAQRGRETFLEAGGLEFTMIPALNVSADWISAMAEMACQDVMKVTAPKSGRS